jgi:hypothetical protein
MADEKRHEPSEREAAMMAAFAQTMRTVMDPLLSRLEQLEAQKTPAVEKLTGDQIHAQMMKALRGQSDTLAEIGLVEMVENCVSDLGATDAEGNVRGATFDAELQYVPVIVDGKIVGKRGAPVCKRIFNYRLPIGFDKHLAEGGIVPAGMTIATLEQVERGDVDREGYAQWLAETFWQADLKRFVGKQLPAHVRPAAAPVQVAATGGR